MLAERCLSARRPARHSAKIVFLLLYLFLPIVRYCVTAAPLSDVRILCGAWFAIAVTTTAVYSYSEPHAARLSLFLGSFFNFAPYCVAGYLLAAPQQMRLADSVCKSSLLWFTAAAMGLGTLLCTCALHGVPHEGKFYFYNFLSITTVPMSLALFCLMPRLSKPLLGMRYNRQIATLAFGIYLIHPAVLKLLASVGFEATAFNPFFAIPALACCVFLLSGICTAIIQAIPILKKTTG